MGGGDGVTFTFGVSCLGASFTWGKLSSDKLSLGEFIKKTRLFKYIENFTSKN